MVNNKLSSKFQKLLKSALAAAILPILFIYIMIAKPDYYLMNEIGHVVLPVANFAGDVITWPVRAVIDLTKNIKELASLRIENEELRVRLDEALKNKTSCEIAIKENQKLVKELDLVQKQVQDSIIADIQFDNSAFHHNTFLINRGIKSGIEKGMVVVSMDEKLVGVVIDVAPSFSKVRSLLDSDTNIAVRIVGSEVYGFLRGNGSSTPTMGFFSDPEFQATSGIKLVTSNISGILPAGIYVGEMLNDADVKVVNPSTLSRVMVLKFDNNDEYK